MSHLLELLGRGLLAELTAAFRDLLRDDESVSTAQLETLLDQEQAEIEHHRRFAVRMLRERQFGKARDAFHTALQLDPADRVARIGQACALDTLGLTHAAIEELQTSLEHHPEDGPTWFAVGFCQEKLGETEDAIAAYESTLDVAPQLRNAHERLAAIYLKLDNVYMAITHYEHLCWCEPDDISASLTLANLYVRNERYDDAIRRFQYALAIDPDNWEAQDDLISTCVEAERYQEGIELLQSMIEQRPECADLYVRLGDLFRNVGLEKQAMTAYSEAADLNPDYLEAMVKVGTGHLRNGDFSEAANSFNRATEISDRIVSGYVGLAVAQQARGRSEEALAGLEMAASLEPNSTLLFSEAARLQLQVSAAEQTTKYLSPQAITEQPDGPPDDDVAAMVDTQIENLRAALRERPRHADLHYRLGLLLRHRGDLHEAIRAYRNAVAINPSYVKALMKLGLALREADKKDEAIFFLEKALKTDPKTIDLHYQLGLMFADQGQFQQALERFEIAVANQPDNLDYLANLALALQNMGLIDYATATWELLAEVVHSSPHGRAILDEVGRGGLTQDR